MQKRMGGMEENGSRGWGCQVKHRWDDIWIKRPEETEAVCMHAPRCSIKASDKAGRHRPARWGVGKEVRGKRRSHQSL